MSAEFGPFSSAKKIVVFNPDAPTQVRQVSGSGSPQWVSAGSATFSECATSTSATGVFYWANLPTGLDTTQSYMIAVYASTATAFSDANELYQYSPGTDGIGAAIATALAGSVNVIVWAAATGWSMSLFAGDSYLASDDRGITITKQGTETHWPATLEDVSFFAEPTAELYELEPDAESISGAECTVTQATGDNQAFTLELETTDTEKLTFNSKLPNGGYKFWFRANVDDPTTAATLRSGPLTVHEIPSGDS